jgi:CrcB protein
MQWGLLLSVGIGGFTGAILRYGISNWVNALSHGSFPYGTLSVNLIGSFFIGFLFLYFQQIHLSPYPKTLLITGLLGALTTFSTFSLDTVLLMQQEQYLKALLNISSNVMLSIGATLFGMFIFKRIYI